MNVVEEMARDISRYCDDCRGEMLCFDTVVQARTAAAAMARRMRVVACFCPPGEHPFPVGRIDGCNAQSNNRASDKLYNLLAELEGAG